MSREAMQMALDTFNKSKRSHYYCEDRFYSCPQHEEGCADALEGDECNCGADTVNKSIDAAIEALRTALAQPEKELVGLTDEERNEIMEQQKGFWISGWEVMCMAAVEKKLKEKNT